MRPHHFSPETDPKIDFDKVSHVALSMLELARNIADIPFIITSTYRTPEHSVKVGGSTKDSHTEIPCTAFDIACSGSRDRFIITRALFMAGFTRIGIDSKHIHVDNSEKLDKRVFWIE